MNTEASVECEETIPFRGDAWYLLVTKPRGEEKAQRNLENQDYRAWLPRIRERKRVGGGYRNVVAPMFPRYLFVRLEAGVEDWGPIRSTPGVSGLVRFGMWPPPVPDALVVGLMRTMDSTGVCDLSRPAVQPGERVRVLEGAMAGYEGVCQARNGRERVTILLDIVGRQTPVTLAEDLVQRTG